MLEDLGSELRDELSYGELLKIAERRGLMQELGSKEDVIGWLLQDGLTWREYELRYNPYIMLKLRVCRFFGIRRGWRVMDLGCGSGGTSVAAASLVGSRGKVLAVDPSEEEMVRCTGYVRKMEFDDVIETRLGNVLDLEFERDYFDMVLLLYTPQFIGYLDDLKEVLHKIKNWTSRIGIADHIPVPVKYDEGFYLLYNWLSSDLARIGMERRTDRLYHPNEIRDALDVTGWCVVRDREFRISKKNSYPLWAMRGNVERLSEQVENLMDPVDREIFSSRLQTIKDLVDAGCRLKPTSMFAAVAER